MSTKRKAAQISKAGGDWELVERDVLEPANEIRHLGDNAAAHHA